MRWKTTIAAIAAAGAVTAALGERPATDPLPTVRYADSTIPPYVASVVCQDAQDHTVGFANAFVVDADNGLLLTNAHVVQGAARFLVFIGSRTRNALPTDAVDWVSDLALIRLEPFTDRSAPLTAASLGVAASVREYVTVFSYLGEISGRALVIREHAAPSVIMDTRQTWAADRLDDASREHLIDEVRRKGLHATPEERYRLYDEYLVIVMLDELALHGGQSGSPLVDRYGMVVGIMAEACADPVCLSVSPILSHMAWLVSARSGRELLDRWYAMHPTSR